MIKAGTRARVVAAAARATTADPVYGGAGPGGLGGQALMPRPSDSDAEIPLESSSRETQKR